MTADWAWRAAVAVPLLLVAGDAASQTRPQPQTGPAGLAQLVAPSQLVAPPGRTPATPANPPHDELMKLSGPDRAARLAGAIGNWCIGTDTFLMGVQIGGAGDGNAYWSLRCAGDTDWAVQVEPSGAVTAIDCAAFKAAAVGKECFKKF